MEFLQDYGLGSQTTLILFLAVFGSAVLTVLILYIRHLRSKLESFENPRYGFLGKSIYPVIGVVMLGSLIFFAGYGVLSPETPDSQAEFQLEGQFNTQVKSQTLAIVNAEFKFTPVLDGQPWGAVNDKFDIYWKIAGPVEITEYELEKSKFDQSGLLLQLPKGSYNIEITVIYQNESFEFSDRVSF